jgi:mannan endo-1,4-beta-mannosidase
MPKYLFRFLPCLLLIAGTCTAQNNSVKNSKNNLSKDRGFKTLAFLYRISGKKTVAGIHNREPNDSPAKWTDHMFTVTGKYPGLWSGDFLFQKENIDNRSKMINETLTQWKKGAIINIMWHACNPALEEPCGWNDKGVLSHMSDQQWEELLADGTKS